ncbi:MFS transporter [Sphaerisporangium krabiense]|uniref:Putative MFS family arabinose efflux permease n=1 Tax=Sphaerisporangium krabiense TaxID=763782 RepID=A0A7W9DQD4_9ACTN|nr:MFS transporter [Sphaerisporangium krabiense]MBB5626919.1 putative MFS family arabinose efflux permease [Sphaerisporangium krabiense]GII66719.1 MFS transporter [Sphaerisporangium krabiense]
MRARSIATVLPGGAARHPVLLLSLGTFALGTDAFVISGVLNEVGRELGVSLGTAGLLITVFSGVYALSAPVLAVVTGNMCRRQLLLLSLAVFVAANVLAAVAPNFTVMILARVAAAIGGAMYTPVAVSVAATLAAPSERGRALAAVAAGLTVANALGVPLGTLIGQAFQWRVTFVFVAVLGVVAYVGLHRALDPLPSPGVASLRQRLAVATLPGVPATLLGTSLAVCGIFTLYAYLAWFAGQSAGIAGGALTVVYLIFGLVAVVSNLTAGVLIDRTSPTRVALLSIVGLAVVYTGLSVFAGLGLSGTGAVVTLAVLVGVWSMIGWLFNPSQQQRLLTAAGPQGTIALSLNASALYTGQAVAGVIGGLMLAAGPGRLALAAAACEVLAVAALAVSALAGRRRTPAAGPVETGVAFRRSRA